jgi:hypothetical protein
MRTLPLAVGYRVGLPPVNASDRESTATEIAQLKKVIDNK